MEVDIMSGERILIVEDEAPMLLDLQSRLQKAGYTVSGTAYSGEEAIALVRETEPDLVLMDINLGMGMDGIEAGGIINNDFKVPVVYSTAYTDPKTVLNALKTNPYGYITKPIRESELLILLQMAFRKHESDKNLREANAMKDKLFSIIAHDLRNAFTVILSGSYLLAEHVHKFEKEKVVKYANKLSKSAENIDKLLENLLTWSRLQMNKIELNPAKLRLFDIAELNINLFREYAAKKTIALNQRIGEDMLAYADYDMVNTVIRNLVNNAVKFSHPGSNVNVFAANEDKNFIEISISDTGVGIIKKHCSQLFRIDSKIKERGTSGEAGTGLGLPLCKEFIEKNGGEIWVESKFGKGSTFKFTLPKFKESNRQTVPPKTF
jgi:two-component system sensor histidine kinase/response regulator